MIPEKELRIWMDTICIMYHEGDVSIFVLLLLPTNQVIRNRDCHDPRACLLGGNDLMTHE